MREYELAFIIHPDVDDEEGVTNIIDRMSEVVRNADGEVAQIEPWGNRELAYLIENVRRGHYVVMQLHLPPDAVAEIERQIQLIEEIIRHLVIRIGE